MNQTMDTATLQSLLHALESLAKRNKFHQRVMLGMVTILGLSGLILLGVGSFTGGTTLKSKKGEKFLGEPSFL